jgi:beta-lactamase superfamily II metal-dependent hydrolase
MSRAVTTPFLICALLVGLTAVEVLRGQVDATLDFYFIDVEGGQATLVVTPARQSMLIDAGNPGDRDAGRIEAVARQAGLTRLDVMLTTHLDGDHHGGVSDVLTRLPVGTFVDHGPRVEDPEQEITPRMREYIDRTDRAYNTAIATGRHVVVNPGDTIPLAGADVRVIAAGRKAITTPLPASGALNNACASYEPHETDHSENSYSIGVVIAYRQFRFLDLGDLTWNREHDLVCPNNLIGAVDVYLTTHHGLTLSGPPALVRAVQPRVAIINNAATKGASAETLTTLRSTPTLQDIWQLHYSVPRQPNAAYYEAQAPGGPSLNTEEPRIANLEANPAHAPAYYIKVSARTDGSFVVTNSRTGVSKAYPAPVGRGGRPFS